ncbi:MAG: four-carbon acid sugar kinase family protein [Geminicoccaceae bacterium]
MLRLLADDLTGALDSAAPFARTGAPIPVLWDRAAAPVEGAMALDCETRDLTAEQAARHTGEAAPLLRRGRPAFKKIDSRLRGHPALEIAVCSREGGFRTTIVAPAFPGQGRVTRDGRQLVLQEGGWRDTGVDLAADLRDQGLSVQRGRPNWGAGVFLCDADSERDLADIVASGADATPPVLWAGSGGLARALARSVETVAVEDLPGPLVLIVGTGHPVTLAQLDRLPAGTVVHRPSWPGGSPVLQEMIKDVVARGRPTGGAIVTGGETLYRLCATTGALRLLVRGEIEPGTAVATIEGGSWDGVTLVTKSGGLGSPDLLRRLVTGCGHA